MSFDDSRGMSPNSNRKPMQQKYGNHGYGHNSNNNSNTNYNSSNYNGNSGYNGNSSYNSSNSLQNQRRRVGGGGGFKPQANNHNDRIIRQNDAIIKLLKEIRDRLPAPPIDLSQPQSEDQQNECQAHDNADGEFVSQNNDSADMDEDDDGENDGNVDSGEKE